MEGAIHKTINITAWDNDKLVDCIRILSDGSLFGTITEILVLKDYRNRGIGRELMRRAIDISPTMLFFGAHPEAADFYKKLQIKNHCSLFV